MPDDETKLDIDVALKGTNIVINGQVFQCILFYECPICKAPLIAFWKYNEGQKGLDDNVVGRALRDSGFNAYRFFESKNGQGFEYDFEKDPNKKHNHMESSGYGGYSRYGGSSEYFIPFMTLNPMFTVNDMLKEALNDQAVDAGIDTPDKALEVLEALRGEKAAPYFKVVDDRMKHGKPILFFNKGKFGAGYSNDPKEKLKSIGLKLAIKELKVEEENPDRRRFRIVTPTVNAGMRYMKVIGRYHTREEAEKDLPRFQVHYSEVYIRGPEARESANPSPYMVWNDVYDSHQGEIFGSIYADDHDNKRVGQIDYSYHDGELDIKIIKVDPALRRKGIGREMMQKLKWEFPDAKIHWGMEVSEEGTAFRKAIEAKRNPAPPEEIAKAKEVVQKFTAKKANIIKSLDLEFLKHEFIKQCDTKTELYESDKWNPDGTIKYYYHPWKDGHTRDTYVTDDKKWLLGLGRCRVTKDGIEDFTAFTKKSPLPTKAELAKVECWGRLATLIGIDVPCGKCSGVMRFIPDDGWHCDKCKGSVPKFKIRRGMVLFDEGTNILLSISKIK